MQLEEEGEEEEHYYKQQLHQLQELEKPCMYPVPLFPFYYNYTPFYRQQQAATLVQQQPIRGGGSMRGRGRGSRTRRGWVQPRNDNMQVSIVSPVMTEEVQINLIKKMIECILD